MTPQALTLLLLALTMAIPTTSDQDVRVAAGGYILAECHQAAPNGSNAASSAFHADLHALLVALPSAAGPTGFASLHSYNSATSVRGLCFDDSPPTGGCAGCLSWAAEKIADEWSGSRRAGAWNAGCFVGYRDTNSSWPHEDAYRGRDFSFTFSTDGVTHFTPPSTTRASSPTWCSVPMMATSYSTTARKGTVSAAAHCASDVTSAGCSCSRCLEESARELPRNCCGGGWALDGRREGVAVVAGFNCHLRLRLRLEIYAPDLPFGKMILKMLKENGVALVVLVAVGIIIVKLVWPAQQHPNA